MSTVRLVDAVCSGSRTGRSIVTLTPAPAIDRTYTVASVTVGGVQRAHHVTEAIGGNGINVTRALVAHGFESTAVFPMSAVEYRPFLDREFRSSMRPVEHHERTRVNTIIITADGATTNVNELPAPTAVSEWTRLSAAALRTAVETDARWLVVTGCLPAAEPTGRPVDLLPLIRAAQATGLAVAVDVPGQQLCAALDPLAPVDLIKPNREELSEATRMTTRTLQETISATRALLARGARRALVTLGGDGMVIVDPHSHTFVPAAVVDCVDTTGAGDAALAGYLAADASGTSPLHAAQQAVRWGAAAVGQPGARLRPTPLTRADRPACGPSLSSTSPAEQRELLAAIS